VVYYFVFLLVLNRMKGASLWKCFLIAGVANGISTLLQFSFFFNDYVPIWIPLACRFLLSLVGGLSVDLLLMPLIGRVSKYLPEGFESTGVVVIISGLNFFSSIQQ
jgi:hypothetical protein